MTDTESRIKDLNFRLNKRGVKSLGIFGKLSRI